MHPGNLERVLTRLIVSRPNRDMRVTSIGGGADEVMLGIICKTMGMLADQKKRRKEDKKGRQASV